MTARRLQIWSPKSVMKPKQKKCGVHPYSAFFSPSQIPHFWLSSFIYCRLAFPKLAFPISINHHLAPAFVCPTRLQMTIVQVCWVTESKPCPKTFPHLVVCCAWCELQTHGIALLLQCMLPFQTAHWSAPAQEAPEPGAWAWAFHQAVAGTSGAESCKLATADATGSCLGSGKGLVQHP